MFIKERSMSTLKRLLIKQGLYSLASAEPKVRSKDIWLVSYPKSGNTYLRFLIASAISGKQVNFYDVDRYVPDIYQVRKHFLEKLPSPRILKSHELARKDYETVVYLVRDPRDVVLSYAYWSNRVESDDEVEDRMDLIVAGWMDRYDAFWNWKEHLTGWISLAESPTKNQKIKWIRYEDLISETERVLNETCTFAGLPVTHCALEAAILNTTKDKMRTGEYAAKPFFSSKNRAFVRGGKRKTFDDLVSAKTKSRFLCNYGCLMERFNYI